MFENLLDAPTAAEVVADDAVKHIAAIATGRSAVAHDLLNFIDAVLGSAAVEAAAIDRGDCFCGCSLAAFSPDKAPVDHAIDIGELTDRVEPVAGDGQCLVGAAKQFDSD